LDYAADYSPYGRVLRSFSAVAQERYLTTQHERDVETGYDNRGARLYDSETGRFIGVDAMAGQYLHLSLYVYVADNPVILQDPTGKYIHPNNLDANGLAQINRILGTYFGSGNVVFTDKIGSYGSGKVVGNLGISLNGSLNSQQSVIYNSLANMINESESGMTIDFINQPRLREAAQNYQNLIQPNLQNYHKNARMLVRGCASDSLLVRFYLT
jgi:RHS repeat-associated protein